MGDVLRLVMETERINEVLKSAMGPDEILTLPLEFCDVVLAVYEARNPPAKTPGKTRKDRDDDGTDTHSSADDES